MNEMKANVRQSIRSHEEARDTSGLGLGLGPEVIVGKGTHPEGG